MNFRPPDRFRSLLIEKGREVDAILQLKTTTQPVDCFGWRADLVLHSSPPVKPPKAGCAARSCRILLKGRARRGLPCSSARRCRSGRAARRATYRCAAVLQAQPAHAAVMADLANLLGGYGSEDESMEDAAGARVGCGQGRASARRGAAKQQQHLMLVLCMQPLRPLFHTPNQTLGCATLVPFPRRAGQRERRCRARRRQQEPQQQQRRRRGPSGGRGRGRGRALNRRGVRRRGRARIQGRSRGVVSQRGGATRQPKQRAPCHGGPHDQPRAAP
jgi:hypothetical protein